VVTISISAEALSLKATGIVYRRKGNTHGFDGLRLRDGDDE
jgi:hypothetical protein